MKHPDPLVAFAIILPVVADEIEEEGLSKQEGLDYLRSLLEGEEQPAEVSAVITRLESAEEFELSTMLGKECVRILRMHRLRR